MRQSSGVIASLILTAAGAWALPLRWVNGFVENRGQWEAPYVYLYSRPGLILGVTPTALVFNVYEQHVREASVDRYGVPQPRSIRQRGQVAWMELEGAAPAMAVSHALEPAVLHFFRGSSPRGWYSSVPVARIVELIGVYPGINLRLSALPEGPRYDFIVQPGADPQRIRLRFRGIQQAALALQGRELRLVGEGGLLLHGGLQAYQDIEGQRREVPVNFVVESLGDGEFRVRFALGEYDVRYPLVIDPIVYATCLGSGADERAPSLQRLADGSMLTVIQAEELSFRMTPGAYDTTYNGLTDVVVLKLDGALQRLLFATYLGGSGADFPAVIGTDANGDIYVGGSTNSPDFPVRNAYQQSLRGGVDLFVVRLSPQGSQLRWGTYIGGSSDEIAVTGAVRRDGIVVLAGRTQSSNYPTTSAAHQRTYAGNWDVFMTGLSNTGASLSFSTYLGGSDNETAWAVFTDVEGYTYLCGETSSSNFPNHPVPTPMNPGNRPYDRDYNGGPRDAFIAKFRPTSATLQYSTFLGGSQEDYATGIVARDNGEVWVTGATRSSNFPAAGPRFQQQLSGGADGFLVRLSSSGLGTAALLYSTYLGGTSDEEPRVVLEYNNAPIVVGWTRSGNFPLTQDAHSRGLAGGQDLFVTVFSDLSALELQYSSFAGTLLDERPLAAAADARGDLYIAGETNSPALCQVVEGLQSGYGGGGTDAFLVKYARALVTLFAPRGGERVCAGSPLSISWMAAGVTAGDTFRIEVSSDRRNWIPIGLVTGTAYAWTVPANQPSGHYWLRVVHIASGVADESDSTFTVAQPPRILQQPPDTLRLCVGDTLVLQVVAEGDSLTYQWYRGGVELPGARQPVLRIPLTSTAQAGQYNVRLRGSCPPEVSSRVSHVFVEERPRIVRQPQDVSVGPGAQACFSVGATGGVARQYQWLKDGTPIPGARDTVYCIPSVSAADSGLYRCVVWNRCGSDTSAAARLRVAVGVSEPSSEAGLVLRWLPSSIAPQRLTLELTAPERIVRAALYSILGQPVAEGEEEIVVAHVPSGVYWLVVSGSERQWVRCVVVVR
ncbi:MAG: SBBP repeat-containing protein [Candidatus Kapabacteria bacterium]|nr:SBBP repeat-containing protein [Candidatus Kapabacteria bacterium]MDW8011583.1 SBBP repeat-containing protein [Bacteroidota bacterium]